MTGILQLIGNVLNILTPFMLRFLVSYVDKAHQSKVLHDSKAVSLWQGLALTLTITTMHFVKGFCGVHATYQGSLLGADLQRGLTENVLTKFLEENKSSPDAHNEALTGKDDHPTAQSNVVTCVTTHPERIGELIASFHQIWTLSISLVVAMVLLSLNLGIHALIGVSNIGDWSTWLIMKDSHIAGWHATNHSTYHTDQQEYKHYRWCK